MIPKLTIKTWKKVGYLGMRKRGMTKQSKIRRADSRTALKRGWVRFSIKPYIPLQKWKIDWRGAGKTERETTDIGGYLLCLSMQIFSFSSFKPASVDGWPVAFEADQYVQRP